MDEALSKWFEKYWKIVKLLVLKKKKDHLHTALPSRCTSLCVHSPMTLLIFQCNSILSICCGCTYAQVTVCVHQSAFVCV